MTLAVCTRCGAGKVGAFSACPGCGFDPETPEDKAKALLWSDHNLPPDRLESIRRSVQAGDPPPFDEAACAELAELIRRHPDVLKMPVGCVLIPWILTGLMLALAAALAALLLYQRWVNS